MIWHIQNFLWILQFPGRPQMGRNYAFLLPIVVFLKKKKILLRNTSNWKRFLDSPLPSSERQSLSPPQKQTFGREHDKTAIALMKQNNAARVRFVFHQPAPAEVGAQAATVWKGLPGPYSTSKQWVTFSGKSSDTDPSHSWKNPITYIQLGICRNRRNYPGKYEMDVQ